MKNKIEISFDRIQYERNVSALQDNLAKYRSLLQAIEQITGNKEFLTLEQVENHITTQTGFKNVLLSAGLLEVTGAYVFIKEHINSIQLDVLDFSGEVVAIKQSVLDTLKEEATSYLADEFIEEYNALLKAATELNKLRPNSANYLKKDYNGKFSVNVAMLNNSNRF